MVYFSLKSVNLNGCNIYLCTDPLETEESLVETLGMLGHIARCKYEESSAALVAIFDPIAAQYQVSILHEKKSG